ncbi:MAG: hypothetical protein DYG88_01250 [Chloroflexi bacterium CFX4]|nr:hypothetical protein [Chloroflexi bacterium CFX4]MDL1921475.1 hypothetical protein [Chloroflexi bacterium CFX3]
MTEDELADFITTMVDVRLGQANTIVTLYPLDFKPDTRTIEEVLASVEANRWTPPPSAKTSLEFLRKSRDEA